MGVLKAPQSFTRKNYFPIEDANGTEVFVWLLTPDEFQDIPAGTILTNIFGKTSEVGLDYIDQDTRFGYIAYGLTEDQFNTE